VGLLSGYLTGYRDFYRTPFPAYIMIVVFALLTIGGIKYFEDIFSKITDKHTIGLTLVFYFVYGFILGGFSGKYLRKEGVIKYMYLFSSTIILWLASAIIIDGVIQSYILANDKDGMFEIGYYSLMGLTPAWAINSAFSTKFALKKLITLKNLGLIGAIKALLSFSIFAEEAIEEMLVSLLWWFDEFPVPNIFEVLLTFGFAMISVYIFKNEDIEPMRTSGNQ
jgi:hypothetical protein